jgi:CheY-like chemotaxis protein
MQQAVMQHHTPHNRSTEASGPSEEDAASVRTVILADDSILQRMMTRAMLEAAGYHVLEAGNGREVLELAASMHPDLIIMDVAMPAMDGISATRRIRADDTEVCETPIVFVSALDEIADRQSALAAGGDEYLVKPVSDRELLRVVERWTDRGRGKTSS